jgi:hypothetical protein
VRTFPQKREKVFGRPGGFPHDRNARIRIEVFVLAWNAARKTGRQQQGPITAAYQRVLKALLWRGEGSEKIDAESSKLLRAAGAKDVDRPFDGTRAASRKHFGAGPAQAEGSRRTPRFSDFI